MNSSAKAKQQELVTSLDSFETSLHDDMGQKLLLLENQIELMQEELKETRDSYTDMKNKLMTYKGQHEDLEKYLEEEAKKPQVCPQCNYPLNKNFKCCPMCGTPIPQDGDPDIDYPIPAGPVVNRNNAQQAQTSEKAEEAPAPAPATAQQTPPPVQNNSEGGYNPYAVPGPIPGATRQVPPPGMNPEGGYNPYAVPGPIPGATRQVPPPPAGGAGMRYFPSYTREADRGDAGTKTQVPPSASRTQVPPSASRTQVPPSATNTQLPPSASKTQIPPSASRQVPPPSATGAETKYFPSYSREADRGDHGETKTVENETSSSFLSRFGFGKKKEEEKKTETINLGTTNSGSGSTGQAPLPPPPPPAGGPVKYFPSYQREADRGDSGAASAPASAASAPVQTAPIPPKSAIEVVSGEVEETKAEAPVAPAPEAVPTPAAPAEEPKTEEVKTEETPVAEEIKPEGTEKAAEEPAPEEAPAEPVPEEPEVDPNHYDIIEAPIPETVAEMEELFEYHEVEGELVIDKYIGTGYTYVTIPDKVDGKPVVAIAGRAFAKNEEINLVEILDGVKFIGSECFFGCSDLRGIDIPQSVKSIKTAAFAECGKLSQLTLPDEMSDIGPYAFYKCASIESVVFPNGLKWISKQCMAHCSSLKEITIPDGIRAIEASAFNECTALEGFEIPNSTVSIGDKAFYGCSSLNKVTIPPSVTRLGTRIFFPKMGQSMIPKLTIFCSNGSPIYTYCRSNNIKSKGATDMPATAPNIKNKAYALEISFWLKDKDDEAKAEIRKNVCEYLGVPEYVADDFMLEDEGLSKELRSVFPIDKSVPEAEAFCEKLNSSIYIQIVHAYDGQVDVAAKNASSPF